MQRALQHIVLRLQYRILPFAFATSTTLLGGRTVTAGQCHSSSTSAILTLANWAVRALRSPQGQRLDCNYTRRSKSGQCYTGSAKCISNSANSALRWACKGSQCRALRVHCCVVRPMDTRNATYRYLSQTQPNTTTLPNIYRGYQASRWKQKLHAIR